MTSDSRANFEEWAKQFHYDLTISDPAYVNRPYVNDFTDWSWQAWSARDSEVERLREALAGLMEGSRYENGMWGRIVTPSDSAMDKARAALSSQVKESGNG